MLEQLKQEVCEANLELHNRGIVIYTWGNVSGIDRASGNMVIKPSGVAYEQMTAEDMVVVNVQTGEVVEGKWKPSSDTATHLELYRAFPKIGGITHTHSVNAVAFAQAGLPVPALGTTHADYFYGTIPCVRNLTEEEIETGYEKHTGTSIIEAFEGRNPMFCPGCVCANHGPFTWGKNAAEAVHNAVVLEEVAKMAARAEALNPNIKETPQAMQDKHFNRKHGPNAYYGQK